MQKASPLENILPFLKQTRIINTRVTKKLSLKPKVLKVYIDDNIVARNIFDMMSRILNIEISYEACCEKELLHIFSKFKSDTHPNKILSLQTGAWCTAEESDALCKTVTKYSYFIYMQSKTKDNKSLNMILSKPCLRIIYELLILDTDDFKLLLNGEYDLNNLFLCGEVDGTKKTFKEIDIESLFDKETNKLDSRYEFNYENLPRVIDILNSNVNILNNEEYWNNEKTEEYINNNEIFMQIYDIDRLLK